MCCMCVFAGTRLSWFCVCVCVCLLVSEDTKENGGCLYTRKRDLGVWKVAFTFQLYCF